MSTSSATARRKPPTPTDGTVSSRVLNKGKATTPSPTTRRSSLKTVSAKVNSHRTSTGTPVSQRRSSVASPITSPLVKRGSSRSPNVTKASTFRSRASEKAKSIEILAPECRNIGTITEKSIDLEIVATLKAQIELMEKTKTNTTIMSEAVPVPTDCIKDAVEKAVMTTEAKWTDRLKDLETDHVEKISKLEEEHRAKLSAISDRNHALEDQKNTELQGAKYDVEKFKTEKKNLELEIKALQDEVEKKCKIIQSIEDEKQRTSSSFWQQTTDIAKRNRVLEDEATAHASAVRRLEEQIDILKEKLKHANAALKELEQERDAAQRRSAELEAKTEAIEREAAENQRKLQSQERRLDELQKENTAMYAQLVAVKGAAESEKAEQHSMLAQERVNRERKLAALQDENARLLQRQSSGVIEIHDMNDPHAEPAGKLDHVCTNKEIAALSNELVESRRIIMELHEKVEELETKVYDGEKIRRKMHNLIQELRGNVRVHVRVRPFLPSDKTKPNEVSAITCDPKGYSLTIQDREFAFDKVYNQTCDQLDVFDDVSDFIQSALDGFNVCIFAYGQTGSGKTHTMQGTGGGHMRGIIPRSIARILERSEKLSQDGWKFCLQVSYLEVYNETLRDLFLGPNDPKEKLTIRCRNGKNSVDGLNRIVVESQEEIEAILRHASANRAVESTSMNAQSSRSHSVFTLYITGTNETQNTELSGSLNLVDLAGSERLSRSHATGDRLKEAQAINKSLSSIADVFVAIGNGSSHIPYRNSKLTQVLQPALSGDGKTLMMVNLSPTTESISESVCSLRFASQVNQCELGKPSRNICFSPTKQG